MVNTIKGLMMIYSIQIKDQICTNETLFSTEKCHLQHAVFELFLLVHDIIVQIFFFDPIIYKVDLLSYKSKTTDKREQYDWMAETKFGRVDHL